MITAHLPSGYILGRSLKSDKTMMIAALIGAVFPDLDMIWFYLVDARAIHHHHYWVHTPFFWSVTAGVLLPLIKIARPQYMAPALMFLMAVFLHLFLDTISGDIKWLWPFENEMYSFIDVQPRYSHWILNFILHPVFLLEVAIWIIALYLWSSHDRQTA